MQKLIAIVAFALSLFGCHTSGTTYITRLHEGSTVLHSEAWVEVDRRAHFECVESSSGLCYYRLYPAGCAAGACKSKPLREFAVSEGDALAFTGTPAFDLEVTTTAQRRAASAD
jgi:hypothetical protein